MPYQASHSNAVDAPGSPSRMMDVHLQPSYQPRYPEDGSDQDVNSFQFSSALPPAAMMSTFPIVGGYATMSVAAFAPGPSVFESLLRDASLSGASTAKFNDELSALNRLTSEVRFLLPTTGPQSHFTDRMMAQ
jgi:hypothetical protein